MNVLAQNRRAPLGTPECDPGVCGYPHNHTGPCQPQEGKDPQYEDWEDFDGYWGDDPTAQ